MAKNELKSLANIAKQRLKNKDYTASKIAQVNTNKTSTYFLKNIANITKFKPNTEFVTISNSEDINFVKKVIELINNNVVLTPIKNLADECYMQNLNEIEKEAYIFNLSERYNKIKINFEHYNNVVNS